MKYNIQFKITPTTFRNNHVILIKTNLAIIIKITTTVIVIIHTCVFRTSTHTPHITHIIISDLWF